MSCNHPEKFYPILKTPALPAGALSNKIALVTGGGTGIGKAIATTFALLGARCHRRAYQFVLVSSRLDVLERTAAEIRSKTGAECAAFQMDVKDPAQVALAVDQIEKKFGTPNILVNNAAGNFIMATDRLSDNAISTVIDIVLKGTLRVTREVGKRAMKNGSGCAVLSITTPYARAGGPFVVPSAVSKAGVETMTKSLATEWAKYGIRFNVIAPGPVPTEGAFGRLSTLSFEDAVEAAGTTVPTGRCGAPEEIANSAAFICSDYGNFINGAIIDVDGGQQHFKHNSMVGGHHLYEMSEKEWDEIEAKICPKWEGEESSLSLLPS